MNIKVISLESGQSKICDHKKLVKKLMEKGRVSREQRDSTIVDIKRHSLGLEYLLYSRFFYDVL